MTIEHEDTFAGLAVVQYDPETGLENASGSAVRVAVDYDEADEFADRLRSLLAEPEIGSVSALIIGSWGEPQSTDSSDLIATIAAASAQLSGLQAIFIGDIVSEECEISWILQSDPTPLLKAFPKLTTLKIRGTTDLSFTPFTHTSLERLIIESGGMPETIFDAVVSSHLPELKHLELWLGDDNYGFDIPVAEVSRVFTKILFPKLEYLGLRDSMIADEIAEELAGSPVLDRLGTLDLSLGTLSDLGAAALLANSSVGRLKRLVLSHHFIGEELQQKLRALPVEVDLDDPQEVVDEDERFVAVSE